MKDQKDVLDDRRLDQLLAEADETAQREPTVVSDPDSTVRKLWAELETIVVELRQPVEPNSYSAEPACVQAVENARTIARIEGSQIVVGKGAELSLSPPPENLGSIGPYQLLDLLGQGGMGTVYKALHPRLEKTVALKVLATGRLKNSDALARFQREMKAIGRLDHPHLIQAFDAGEADGTHYLVMEFAAGTDLGGLLKKRGSLPIAEACELISQAAVGLQAAHSRGMIHRDIKPANLMLVEQEFGPPVVKVLDLGLALLADAQGAGGDGLTSQSEIMGTIDYMAPEQAENSHSVDVRADVYSLGATLYALLTGGSIFSDRPNRTLMQKLSALANEPVPSVRTRRVDVSDALESVVHRMLSRRSSERFASMTDVIAALKPFAAGAELSALLSPYQHDAPASGSFDANTRLISTENALADDHSLARRAGGTSATVEFSRNTRASGSSVVPASEPDTRAFRLRKKTRTAIAVAGVLLLAAILLSIKTPNGEIIVSIPDDLPAELRNQIKINVTGDGAAEVASEANGWRVGIKEGNYRVELTGGKDRVQVEDKQVTVSRNKKAIVTITTKSHGAVASSDKPADPDRQFAEWLKSFNPPMPFEVTLADGAGQRVLPQDPLPAAPFRVHFVFLEGKQFDQQGDAFLEEFTNRVKGLRISGLQLHSPSLTSDRVARFTQLPELSGLTTLMVTSDMVDDTMFQALARLPNLQFVDLKCPRITGKGLGTLRRLAHLALLNGQNVSVEGLVELRQHKIDLLQISDCRFTDQHVDTFAKMKLRRFYTDDAGIDDAMAARLANIHSLEELSLHRSPITDRGLPELKRLKNLTRLVLTGTKVTAAGVADLQKALPNCKIESDVVASDSNRQFAEWLKSFDPPFPFEVTLANGSIQSVPVESPLPTVPFRVHLVYLIGPHFEQTSDAFLDEFTKRVKGQRITGLFLKSSTLTSAGVARLTQMPEFSVLHTLSINCPLVDDIVFKTLAPLPNLQWVDLKCPQITGKELGTLRRMKNLSMLSAERLTVEGLAELQSLKLDYLQIDGIKFTEPVVDVITKLKLKALLTHSAGIDDAFLARIAEMTTLIHLEFYHDPITDAGLMELKRLKKLIKVHLVGTNVTAAGVADLQKALPNCKIGWDAPKE